MFGTSIEEYSKMFVPLKWSGGVFVCTGSGKQKLYQKPIALWAFWYKQCNSVHFNKRMALYFDRQTQYCRCRNFTQIKKIYQIDETHVTL